jgi:hypothetical protein
MPIVMTNLVIKTSTVLFLLATLGPSAASAAPISVTGSAALAVAAVVAQHSPLLSADEKKLIAGLFDGGAKADAKAGNAPRKKLSIMADSILCKASNVDLTARSCEIIFKAGKRASFKGREANEVFATLAIVGVTPEGAAGSIIENVSKLNCTLDPGAINDKSGGGAECSFRTGE